MTNNDHVVTVTPSDVLAPGQRWSPVEGGEATLLLEAIASISTSERDTLTRESLSILGRCTDPQDPTPSHRAGLVVGGVQSGKTLSFTTVMALAKDNGYHLVILVAGTKENLLEQSRDRLAQDLRLNEGGAHYRWVHHKSPKPQDNDAAQIAADLQHALRGDVDGDEAPSVLITAMKNHTHMANTAAVLRQVAAIVNMNEVCALVIDDEADQATPNLRRTGESATYRNMREIRVALPRHTLLEYTATPQAPLLVSLADEISPDFTWVITPGADYTGGRFFFDEHRDTFLEQIPPPDLACLDNPSVGPPESLMRAVAVFFVGAAAAQVGPRRPAQRSMLVHPSQSTLPHAAFRTWIDNARRAWVTALEEGAEDAEDVISDYLRPAFDDLARSVPDLPAWDQILQRLPTVLARARIEEVNARSGRSPGIEWGRAYAWVLVGGALMDRGFTVEGLTVTYMPRGTGVGNADTLQQRARFFGYKRRYAGYCRAWLELDVADAFTSYVRHEEAIRSELSRVAVAGEPLRTWRRRFLLDPALRLTRQATIRMPIVRYALEDRWLQQWHVPLPADDDDIVAENRAAIDHMCGGLEITFDGRLSGPTPAERHDRATLTLADAYERLLVELRMVEGDQAPFLGLLLSIEDHLSRNPDPGCVIYRMSQGRSRDRAVDGNSSRIKSLFQGRSHDRQYLGDRFVRDDSAVTIQIHTLDIKTDGQPGDLIRAQVPFVAVWIPAHLELESALVQT